MPQAWNARTGLDLSLLRLADDELVELLLVFGAEVLQALLGFGRDLELVHCECGCCCGWSDVVTMKAMTLVMVWRQYLGSERLAVWLSEVN